MIKRMKWASMTKVLIFKQELEGTLVGDIYTEPDDPGKNTCYSITF